jgi:predicted RNase H-like HicB family nuclease
MRRATVTYNDVTLERRVPGGKWEAVFTTRDHECPTGVVPEYRVAGSAPRPVSGPTRKQIREAIHKAGLSSLASDAAADAVVALMLARPDHITVAVERDHLDGGYVTQCVELPGAISQGDTLTEALINIADAIHGTYPELFPYES